MTDGDFVVGIDLGTTYSEIAAFVGDRVRVLGTESSRIMPSCVGISPEGQLLVGEAARNQLVVYPERTKASVKRDMGSEEKISLGDQTFQPQEISALILRELADRAASELGRPVERAVITVPAYFSDAQRNATREAGALAGLEVVRILNEPTAASLAYGFGEGGSRTVLVYDLGGGTFDVSVVTIEAGVTEVLASHGNNRLGGDDFDRLLLDRLLRELKDRHGLDLGDMHRPALARLERAAEEAKRTLSSAPHARVREETLLSAGGEPVHLEVEISREEYEEMIRPHIESTLESVSVALQDAQKSPGDLDAILLAGGSTRTPLVWRMLEERAGITPRQEVHPDLCVALGAGVLASRLSGHDVERVLVDVSPYSFGPSYLGERDGVPYSHCYRPIIRRNTPLPVTRTERYYTSYDYQTQVDIDIYQGDDPDALKNILVGNFSVTGLAEVEGSNEVLCRMSLDLDGCLQVAAIEKRTGLSKQITITNALESKSAAELQTARKRLRALHATRHPPADVEQAQQDAAGSPEAARPESGAGLESVHLSGDWQDKSRRARDLLRRSQRLLDTMHEEDRADAAALVQAIESALEDQNPAALDSAGEQLGELLFFIEGR